MNTVNFELLVRWKGAKHFGMCVAWPNKYWPGKEDELYDWGGFCKEENPYGF
jgi:hypothetical protein